MVVFGSLKQYPKQPISSRSAAQTQHGLIQVLLGLQGQQQLTEEDNKKHMTFNSLSLHKGSV